MLPIDFKKIQQNQPILLIAKGEVGGEHWESSEVFRFKQNTYGNFMALDTIGRDSFPNIRRTFIDDKPRFRYPYRNEVKLCTK